MSPIDVLLLSLLVMLAAALYSSVGHGGASAYLAAMALFGLAPSVMKPTALCLNLLVASLTTFRFYRAGHFSARTFLPFAAASVPFAFLGGALALPAGVYKPVVGVVLVYAAVRLFIDARARADAGEGLRTPPLWLAALLGAGLGFLSGLTGVGGGIFLSPLLLLMRWADVRRTAGVSAAFILVNSAAGLLGNVASVKSLPPALPYLAAAALFGGLVGSELGSRRLPSPAIRRLLALVLVIAGGKLIFA
ncbi:MAG TPA: sulfite exporter TauE/SafE family protein [Pyrinomonadaceae bacterium]